MFSQKKLLREDALTMDILLKLARNEEISLSQANEMKNPTDESIEEQVNQDDSIEALNCVRGKFNYRYKINSKTMAKLWREILFWTLERL